MGKSVNRILSFLLSFLMITIFIGCSSHKQIISAPEKIIIYRYGEAKEITKDNKSFKKIVELANDRIDSDKISTALDIIDDSHVDKFKQAELSVEFIYDKEQEMNVKGDGFQPFKYYKLFFPLKYAYENDMTFTFQYGNEEDYIDCSRGPLKSPASMINFVKGL